MTGTERDAIAAMRSAALQIATTADAILSHPYSDTTAPTVCTATQHAGPQQDLTTMGGPRKFYCPTCQQTYEPKED